MKVSVRSRLKLFYRPKGLPGSPQDAVNQLRWRVIPEGNGYAVECENPGPYNVSFNHIGLKDALIKNEEKQSGMCPSKGKKRFTIIGSPEADGWRLALITIDDFGGYHYLLTKLSY